MSSDQCLSTRPKKEARGDGLTIAKPLPWRKPNMCAISTTPLIVNQHDMMRCWRCDVLSLWSSRALRASPTVYTKLFFFCVGRVGSERVLSLRKRGEKGDAPSPHECGAWEGQEEVIGAHEGQTAEVEGSQETPQSKAKEEEAR